MTDDDKMDALLRQMAVDDYNRPPEIVPREQMWDVVLQGVGQPAAGGRSGHTAPAVPLHRRAPRWIAYAVAATLLLAVGIQVGRRIGSRDAQLISRVTPSVVGPDSLGPKTVAPESLSVEVPPTTVAQVDERRSDDGPKGPQRPKGGPERMTSPTLGNDIATSAYTVAATQHLTETEAMLTAFKGDLSRGRMDAEISLWGKDLLSNTRLLLDSPAAQDPVRRKLLQDLELVLVQIVQLSPNSSARDRDLIKGALTDDQVLTRLRTAIPVKGT